MKIKKSKWLLLLALISATLMCACGNKDVEEAPVPETAQTVETTKTTSTIDYSCYDDLIKRMQKVLIYHPFFVMNRLRLRLEDI